MCIKYNDIILYSHKWPSTVVYIKHELLIAEYARKNFVLKNHWENMYDL